jgi:plasmid stabilization system protein ParE
MQEIEIKPVVFSNQYFLDTEEIFKYGVLTFGAPQAQKYESVIDKISSELSSCYLMYPECRYLQTKGKIYRWVILDAHFIIYRISANQIEVLRVISSRVSVSKLRTVKKVNI